MAGGGRAGGGGAKGDEAARRQGEDLEMSPRGFLL